MPGMLSVAGYLASEAGQEMLRSPYLYVQEAWNMRVGGNFEWQTSIRQASLRDGYDRVSALIVESPSHGT